MAQSVEVPYLPAPTKLAYQFLELTKIDWLVLFAGILLSLRAGHYLSLPGTLAVLVLTGAQLYPLLYGRRYVVWLMRFYGWFWIEKVLDGVLWTSGPRELLGWWRKLLVWMFVEPSVYSYRVDKLFDIGLNYNTRLRTDSVIIAGDGSQFFRLSPMEQDALEKRLADEMAKYARYRRLRARVSLGSRRRPLDGHRVLVEQNEHMRPDTYLPRALVELKARGLDVTPNNVEQLVSDGVLSDAEAVDFNHYVIAQAIRRRAPEVCRESDYVAVLTVPRSGRVRLATGKDNRKLSPEEAMGEQLINLAQAFLLRLSGMGIKNPRILNQDEVEVFNRAGWDVVSIDRFRTDRLAGRRTQHHPEREIRVKDGVMTFDNESHHAVIRLTGLPHQVAPDDFTRLFGALPTEGSLSVSKVSTVVSGNKEYRWLGFFLNLVEDIIGHLRTRSRTQRRFFSLLNVQERIDEQRHISYFDVLIDVGDGSKAVVESDVRLVMDRIAELDASAERVVRPEWLAKYALSAATVSAAA